MQLDCDRCGANYSVDDDLVGQTPVGVECPHCGHIQTINPSPAGVTAPISSLSGPPNHSSSSLDLGLELEPHSYSSSREAAAALGFDDSDDFLDAPLRDETFDEPLTAFQIEGPNHVEEDDELEIPLDPSSMEADGEQAFQLGSQAEVAQALESISFEEGPGPLPSSFGQTDESDIAFAPRHDRVASSTQHDFQSQVRPDPALADYDSESSHHSVSLDESTTTSSESTKFDAEAREPAYCRECGVLLQDEFDRVLGLCETHQQDQRDEDLAVESFVSSGGWYARAPGGEVTGPISLDEMRRRIRSGTVSLSASFSSDGEDYQTIYAFREIAYLTSLNAEPSSARRSRFQFSQIGERVVFFLRPLAVVVLLLSVSYIGWIKRAELLEIYQSALVSDIPNAPERASPVRRLLAQWQSQLTNSTPDSIESYLKQAHVHQDQDRWAAYAEAEIFYQRALIQEDTHPDALAGFVENFAFWRYATSASEERQFMRQILQYARLISPQSAAVHRAGGALAWVASDLDGCRTGADKALQVSKNDVRARLLLASCYIEGNPELAVQEIKRIRTEAPLIKRADRVLAHAYRRTGQFAQAYEVLESRLRSEPKNAVLHVAFGQIDRSLGYFERALQRFSRATQLPGDKQKAWILKGNLLIQQGRFTKAIKALSTAAKVMVPVGSRGAWLHSEWARAELERGRYLYALRQAEEAAKLQPVDLGALVVLGEAQLAEGELDLAAKTVLRALNLRSDDVDDPVALVLAGRVASQLQQSDIALRRFRIAADNAPKDPRFLALLAAEYLAQGHDSQAYAVMRKAVELEPKPQQNVEGLRSALLLARQPMEEAIEQFKASARDPHNAAVAWSAIGLIYLHLNQRPKALSAIRKSLALDDANVLARIYDAYLALEANLWKRAERSLKRVFSVERGNAMAHLLRARVRLQRGNEAGARNDYASALRSSPGLLAAEIELASLDLQTEDPAREDAARKVLKKAFSLTPESIPLRRILIDYPLTP